jgi:hypothetical protein
MMLAIMFAVLAAGSNARGTVLQRRAATVAPESRSPLGLVGNLLRNPVWLGGILGVICSAMFSRHWL